MSRHVRSLFICLTLVAIVCCQTPPLSAQRVKSSLSGMVTDPSGATVPGAEVVLTNEGTNVSTRFVTGADGAFVFPFLDPVSYALKVTAPGFKVFLWVDPSSRTSSFSLQVGNGCATLVRQ
jgi:hypothetical protein